MISYAIWQIHDLKIEVIGSLLKGHGSLLFVINSLEKHNFYSINTGVTHAFVDIYIPGIVYNPFTKAHGRTSLQFQFVYKYTNITPVDIMVSFISYNVYLVSLK